MASEKILEAKKAKVAELTDLIKNSAAGVLVDYKGINVEDDTKLRRELRAAGVNYFVEKNSMLRFAFKNAGYEGFDSVLEGTTAIALSDSDQTAPARILGEYTKNAGENSTYALKAGFIENEIYDAAGVMTLSKIPSKEILLSQLLGALQGPMQKFAATVQAIAENKSDENGAA